MAVTALESLVDGYSEQLDDKRIQLLGDMGLDEGFVSRRRIGLIKEPLRPVHNAHLDELVLPYMTVNRRTLALRVDPFNRGPFIEGMSPVVYNVTHAMPTLRSDQVVVVNSIHSCLLLLQSGVRTIAVEQWIPWEPMLTELLKNSKVILFNEGQPEQVEPPQRSLTRAGCDWVTVQLGRRLWEEMTHEAAGPRAILEGRVHVDH